jgi:hypothetical protein
MPALVTPRAPARRDSISTGPPSQWPASARPRNWPSAKRTVPASLSTGGRSEASGIDALLTFAVRRHVSGLPSAASPRASASTDTSPLSRSRPCPCNARRSSGDRRSPLSAACSRGAPRRGQSMRAPVSRRSSIMPVVRSSWVPRRVNSSLPVASASEGRSAPALATPCSSSVPRERCQSTARLPAGSTAGCRLMWPVTIRPC